MRNARYRADRRRLLAGSAAGLTAVALGRAGAQPSAGTSLAGETVLVTGSTDGLGREIALRLGALGAETIVHGRNRERGAEVVDAIESKGGRATFYRADLASLAAVRELVEMIGENHDSLSLLVNNAGIWTDGDNTRRNSADGHELIFAVNYLAPYVLCHGLLPLLERGAPSRIINVASIAQQPLDFDDIMLTRDFDAGRAYAQSKLALIMLTFDLAAELPPARITANAVHPATLMDTTMVEKAGAQPMTTVDDGADAVMQLAASPALAGRSGLYFDSLDEARAHAQSYDTEARAKLRMLSWELTGIG